MIRKEQIELIESLDSRLIEVLKSKGEDYATEDVLSNFKQVSSASKVLNIDVGDPTNYALFMCILKIARLTNLINNNKTPNNESIDDSFVDLIGYSKLAYCNYKDNEK
jgi:hypothetical protein